MAAGQKTIARLQCLKLELSKGSINELITDILFIRTCDIAADSPSAVVALLESKYHCSCNIASFARDVLYIHGQIMFM